MDLAVVEGGERAEVVATAERQLVELLRLAKWQFGHVAVHLPHSTDQEVACSGPQCRASALQVTVNSQPACHSFSAPFTSPSRAKAEQFREAPNPRFPPPDRHWRSPEATSTFGQQAI